MQYLPIGRHSFDYIRQNNLLYVDKTEYSYKLITEGSIYFLSRPRRFGKSLLVSTLKAIFEGRRELFEGLWICQHTDYNFEPYHVLHFDMSKSNIETPEKFKRSLDIQVNLLAELHDIQLKHQDYDTKFSELIEKLGQIKKVVILIDEYDKPLLDHLTTPMRDEMKNALKAFYIAIKASDQHLRFILLTGVTKFSKISVFSGLNNLVDISMAMDYAEILGFTQAELETCFADYLQVLAKEQNITLDELIAKIKLWYNGYRFSEKDIQVYNPFSTLLLLQQRQFDFHWFETGTPTFLLELIKSNPQSWQQIPQEKWASKMDFSTYEVERLKPLPLLFQSGYLTIQDMKTLAFSESIYLLDYPNFEVRRAFLGEILQHFSDVFNESSYIYRITELFKNGEIDEVLEELKVFFASVPYDLHVKYERYYQTIFFAIFKLLGFNIKTEVKTNRGRIDAVVDMHDMIYLFEFKLFDTKEAALEQIKTNKYFQQFMRQGKKVMMIGVEFDKDEKNIGDWLVDFSR